MAIFSSNNLRVWLDAQEVPNQQNVTMRVNNSLYEATTKPTRGFTERISGIKDATVTIDGILDSDFFSRYAVGDAVNVRYGTIEHSLATEGHIVSIEYTGGTDEAIAYSISIESRVEVQVFVPLFEQQFLCDTDGTILCDTDGTQLCVPVQTN